MKAEIRSIAIGIASLLVLSLYASTASADVDLSGTWTGGVDQDSDTRGSGPPPVSYMGIPLNAQARAAAVAYTPETINEIDRECQPWPVTYLLDGGGGGRISPAIDQNGMVVAWNITGSIDREPMTIWMDGRSAPSARALDEPAGFTIGRWEGDTLVTTTTHIQDSYLTRNGVPSSDQEVVTMYITRLGNVMTVTGIVQDPVYLTAPWILSEILSYNPNVQVSTDKCSYSCPDPATCAPEEEVPDVLNGHVPTYVVPSANPTLNYMTTQYGIPHVAALGGAQTMYPQFIRQIKGQYRIPKAYCTYNCCGSGGMSLAFQYDVLHCKKID